MSREHTDIAAAYDLWAGSYDSDHNRTRELAADVLRQAPLDVTDLDVVEIGCGTGRNTAWLAERARGIRALDLSTGMLAQAQARVRTPNVEFVRHDVQQPWPVDTASADVVIAMLVLEHVQHVEPVFAEAGRVLRPGGALFVCELHPMRQLLGRQAEFVHPETGTRQLVAAFLHDTSEFLNAGLRTGHAIELVGEWRDGDAARIDAPRLLSVLFRRSGSVPV